MAWWDTLFGENKAVVDTANIRYVEYPRDAGGVKGAAAVACTDKNDGGVTPWDWGVDGTIAAADLITSDYWLAAVEVCAGNAAAETGVRIGTGAGPTYVFYCRVTPITDAGYGFPIWLPFPIKTAAKAQIVASICTAASSGKVLSLSVVVGQAIGT